MENEEIHIFIPKEDGKERKQITGNKIRLE